MTSLGDEFSAVASPVALALALESLAIKSRYQKADKETQRAKIRHLEARFDAQWGDMGAVAEAFGLAWAEAKDSAAAIRWYRRALAANDASASLKVSEQLGNLCARQAWETVDQACKQNGRVSAEELSKARTEIEAARDHLERVVAVQPSIERESLLGSAWKRLALVEAIAGRPRDELAAIASMQASYAKAEARARDSHHPELFYPALNRMAAELILNAGKPGGVKFDPDAVNEVRKSLAAKARDDPDFWSVAGFIELRMYTRLPIGVWQQSDPRSKANSKSSLPASARLRCGARSSIRRHSYYPSTRRAQREPSAAPLRRC